MPTKSYHAKGSDGRNYVVHDIRLEWQARTLTGSGHVSKLPSWSLGTRKLNQTGPTSLETPDGSLKLELLGPAD